MRPNPPAPGLGPRVVAGRGGPSISGGEGCRSAAGLIVDKADFEGFRQAIDEGFIDAFTAWVRASCDKVLGKSWEGFYTAWHLRADATADPA
jgi:hypothetical protein